MAHMKTLIITDNSTWEGSEVFWSLIRPDLKADVFINNASNLWYPNALHTTNLSLNVGSKKLARLSKSFLIKFQLTTLINKYDNILYVINFCL